MWRSSTSRSSSYRRSLAELPAFHIRRSIGPETVGDIRWRRMCAAGVSGAPRRPSRSTTIYFSRLRKGYAPHRDLGDKFFLVHVEILLPAVGASSAVRRISSRSSALSTHASAMVFSRVFRLCCSVVIRSRDAAQPNDRRGSVGRINVQAHIGFLLLDHHAARTRNTSINVFLRNIALAHHDR
jgi:hypothetical protein